MIQNLHKNDQYIRKNYSAFRGRCWTWPLRCCLVSTNPTVAECGMQLWLYFQCQLSGNTLGGTICWVMYLGPCCWHERPRLSFKLLAPTWPNPGSCGHLGSKLRDGSQLSHPLDFSISLFLNGILPFIEISTNF